MAKGGGRGEARAPPVQEQRRKIGQFKRKLDKKETTEVHNKAVARKQELPVRKLVLGGISFAAACTLLYMYLSWILLDEEDA
jgi:hypothetical protein